MLAVEFPLMNVVALDADSDENSVAASSSSFTSSTAVTAFELEKLLALPLLDVLVVDAENDSVRE